jgi:hypothetical protein
MEDFAEMAGIEYVRLVNKQIYINSKMSFDGARYITDN